MIPAEQTVPVGWELKKIRDVATVRSGSTPSRAQHERYFHQGIYPWVKTMDLTDGYIYRTNEKITELALKETSCPLLPESTVLVAMYGGFNQIGRTGLLKIQASINQAISAISTNSLVLEPEYLLHWLNANVDYWKVFAASSRKDPNITRSDVEAFPVFLPPLPEQRKIAAILSTWDEAIALTEQLIAALKQRKHALMQLLLTGQVRFREFEGSEWEESALKNVVTIEYGKSANGIEDENGQYFIYGTGGVTGQTNQYISLNPAVVIGRKGTIDQPQLVLEPFWAIDTTFYCQPVGNLDLHWFYYLVTNLGLETYNEGSTLPSLSRNTLYDLTISLPPLNEQHKVADVLVECDKSIAGFADYQSMLQKQKRGLMQQLLTGAVRVAVEE